MKDAIERRLLLAFGLALLVLFGDAWISMRASHTLINNEQQVSRSLESLNTLEAVVSDITEAESGERGYIITGRGIYLDALNGTADRLHRLLAQLAVLTAGNPSQLQLLAQLRGDVASKLDELEAGVAARRTRGFAAAQSGMLTERGLTTMTDIRRTIAAMEADENARLGEHARESAAAAAAMTQRLLVASILVAMALLVFFTASIRGLAERKRLVNQVSAQREAAEAGSRAKDDFLAIASHELRTPVMALGLQIQIIRRALEGHPDLDRIRRLALDLDDDSRRLGVLVAGLLDMTRIASGQLRIEPEDADFCAIVHSAVAAVHPLLGSAPPIAVQCPGALAGRWDRVRMEQVVVNLLSNAVRYGRPPIQVTVEAGITAVSLVIRDNGPGIPPELLPRLFNRFERGFSDSRGLGLGLYITRRIVASHGGSIHAANPATGGTEFTVVVPRVTPDEIVAADS